MNRNCDTCNWWTGEGGCTCADVSINRAIVKQGDCWLAEAKQENERLKGQLKIALNDESEANYDWVNALDKVQALETQLTESQGRAKRVEAEASELRKALEAYESFGNYGYFLDVTRGLALATKAQNLTAQALASTPLAAEHLAKDERIDGALREARHELTTLHGLEATDRWNVYYDALRDGADHNGAYDALRDVTWVIDAAKVIEQIDEALGGAIAREALGEKDG